MFEINVEGLKELEGGKEPWRLALEPVANVFDEFRGYGDGTRKKPLDCDVFFRKDDDGRGIWMDVRDNGAGFSRPEDIWTLFGTTAKRGSAEVAGRFNAGDKQLIASALEAQVVTGSHSVTFCDGQRTVNEVVPPFGGTEVSVLMPWSIKDKDDVIAKLRTVIPPRGLCYNVDRSTVLPPPLVIGCAVTLPTVALLDGVMKTTNRKGRVYVMDTPDEAFLYELGVPVCSLKDVGFPYSLDVHQKVPVPMSRDSVSPKWMFRLIGGVIQAATLDGEVLLSPEEQGAPFIKGALEWVRDAGALQATIKQLYGDEAVRQSSDSLANAQAVQAGATVVSGKWFTDDTRRRLADESIMPTAKEKFGGTPAPENGNSGPSTCPRCGGVGVV